MTERVFLSTEQDFGISRNIARNVFLDGFLPDVVAAVWMSGAPAGTVVHDSLKALARYHGLPQPRYHNAVKAEHDGSIKITNIGPVLDEINDGDKVLVVGNIFPPKRGDALKAVIDSIINNGKQNLDVRDAVQILKPIKWTRKPKYYGYKEEDPNKFFIFPYQLADLTDKELETYRPDVANFLLRGKGITVPSIPPGDEVGDKMLFVKEVYPMGRDITRLAYLDGLNPTYFGTVWRGGTQVAIGSYKLMVEDAKRKGLPVPRLHNVVKLETYSGRQKAEKGKLKKATIDAMARELSNEDGLLVIDDVHDTGESEFELRQELESKVRQFSFYVLFHKPKGNTTGKKPDGYLYKTERWVVLPHETEEWCFEGEDGPFIEAMRPNLQIYRPEIADLFTREALPNSLR